MKNLRPGEAQTFDPLARFAIRRTPDGQQYEVRDAEAADTALLLRAVVLDTPVSRIVSIHPSYDLARAHVRELQAGVGGES